MAINTTIGAPNSDGYVTEEQVKAFALQYSTRFDLSGKSTDSIESSIRIASRYVEGLGQDAAHTESYYWPGSKVTAAQSRKWPRNNASYTNGLIIPNDVIPPEFIDAVLFASCHEIGTPGLLQEVIKMSEVPNEAGVGPLKTGLTRINMIEQARNCPTDVKDCLSEILREPHKGNIFVFAPGDPNA